MQVLTSSRVVDGRTLYEISIGYFASRADAQRTQAQLLRRFPKAFVMALAPEVPDAAGAAPAVAQDFDAQAAELLAQAEAALQRLDHAAALEPLGKLLELPPNRSTRQAQELIGRSRLQMGDVPRARAEFELFLKQYPVGEDSERVRQQLAALPVEPAPQQAKARADTAPTVTGSLSATYFGGRSKVRNQEFQDSPLGGLVEVPGSNTLSNSADQKQLITSVDLNWRQRDAERDVRFVLRDSYTNDYMPGKLNKNKLSALYLDYRWLGDGVSLRAGRQSPTGGGVFSRFDGVQAGFTLRPRLKLGMVTGVPTDKIADSKRHFYGVSLDAEALTPNLAGSLYLLQQKADQVVERRGLGGDLRYFNGGVSLSGSLDYDLAIHGINLASVQGTWTLPDSTTFNMMWDRRATPLLMLTNRLFYADPAVDLALGRSPTRLTDLLGLFSADQLRYDVKGMTPYMTQGMLGMTTPLNANWQIGSNLSLTNIGAIPPVPGLLDQGQPSTGNLWSGGLQLIGSNLYSARDTHVIGLTYIRGPEYSGYQVSYNNLSALNEFWTLEPSLRYYTQTTGMATANTDSTRWTPGLRVGYRAWQQVTLEAEASLEIGKTNGSNGGTGTSSVETARRLFYYVGGRYDF
jgi:tetratricopeptide (TPR) repeat protein